LEEGELMRRIGQSQATRYEPHSLSARPGPAQQAPSGQPTRQAPSAQPTRQARPGQEEPGSLFRPRRPSQPGDQP
jgi:hypothetical protein